MQSKRNYCLVIAAVCIFLCLCTTGCGDKAGNTAHIESIASGILDSKNQSKVVIGYGNIGAGESNLFIVVAISDQDVVLNIQPDASVLVNGTQIGIMDFENNDAVYYTNGNLFKIVDGMSAESMINLYQENQSFSAFMGHDLCYPIWDVHKQQ